MLCSAWMEGKVACLGVRIWRSCYETGQLTIKSANAAVSLELSLRDQYVECHVLCPEIWEECVSCGENVVKNSCRHACIWFCSREFELFFFFSWLLQFLATWMTEFKLLTMLKFSDFLLTSVQCFAHLHLQEKRRPTKKIPRSWCLQQLGGVSTFVCVCVCSVYRTQLSVTQVVGNSHYN